MSTLCRTFLSHISSQKRCFRKSACLNIFWEKDDKGGYDTKMAPLPFKQRMRHGLDELKKEIALWKSEVKETWESDPVLIYRPGEVDIAWDFRGDKPLEKWIVTCDKDHNEGFSNCTLNTNKAAHALFSGEIISRTPLDGKVKRSGYCNIKTERAKKSFRRELYLDWHCYNMLIMRIRGDGRNYLLNINTRGYFDVTWNDVYHYVLYTRGGPYWQVARIPFSKFFFSSKGRVQDRQEPIPLNKVTAFGITAARYPGNFSLEIDYIGLEFDPTHTEEFAYELYELPQYIVN